MALYNVFFSCLYADMKQIKSVSKVETLCAQRSSVTKANLDSTTSFNDLFNKITAYLRGVLFHSSFIDILNVNTTS